MIVWLDENGVIIASNRNLSKEEEDRYISDRCIRVEDQDLPNVSCGENQIVELVLAEGIITHRIVNVPVPFEKLMMQKVNDLELSQLESNLTREDEYKSTMRKLNDIELITIESGLGGI